VAPLAYLKRTNTAPAWSWAGRRLPKAHGGAVSSGMPILEILEGLRAAYLEMRVGWGKTRYRAAG